MDILIFVFIFVLGTIVGSFLNVCIHRMPRDLSIVTPRSACPHCKAKIPWRENIPLVSYLLLRGKCGRCKRPISVRYFAIELMSGLLWFLLWQQYGFSIPFAVSIFFFSLLLVTVMTDFETGLIPDDITYLGMIVGVISSVGGNEHFPQALWYQRLGASVLGLVSGGAILFLTGWLGKLVFRKDSMGGGDVKLLAMIGAFIGFPKVGLVFLLSPFPALPLALWQRFVKKEETIPFGPFLALTGALFYMHSEVVIAFLSNLYGV